MRTARLRDWLFCLLLLAMGTAYADPPAVALFYGDHPPWDELRAFDVVVVEPDHPGLLPQLHQHPESQVFAYVSVGEANPAKPYFKDLPAGWLVGTNKAWGSRIIDQAQAQWPEFFVDKVLAPLWAQGYRGFFLDTLDSWQQVAATPAARAAQQAGLVKLIRLVKSRWPQAKLILNRGFEILPQVHDDVWMVAAESLYQGYDPEQQRYAPVSADERRDLLQQLKKVKAQYHLPVLVIDYVPPEKRALARETAAAIRRQGFIPWVSTPELDMLGVGEVEVLPRKVVVLYDPAESPDLQTATSQSTLGIILAYLGLVPEFHPLSDAPPAGTLAGRYAGVISWIDSDHALLGTAWPAWLQAQVEAGLPLAVFSNFGVGSDHGLLTRLGLRSPALPDQPRLTLVSHDSKLMGFEMPARARPDVFPLQLSGPGQPLLSLQGEGQQLTPAALTPWGGYVLAPYVVDALPEDEGRWVVNPLAFLRAALRLDPSVPVPDVTTENGRRLSFVHIDGDGFANQAERPQKIYAGEVLRDEILKRYRYPTTASVIEGEVGPDGLYPQLSPRLEKAARDIFALPWVEVASHTYSHPFSWRKAEAAAASTAKADNPDDDGYHLAIPGYRYSLEREILGARDYIDSRLAPPGKKVKILLWSGDCVATPRALAEVKKAGLLNMNGGDTTRTRSQNSWTRMAGLGLPRGDGFQVFAPNQNENIYTHDWTGPYYGFDKVIETFELTDHPYRFKPVDLYYHTYSTTKDASLAALHRVYAWLQRQPLHPVFASDYIRKVLDYNHMVVARTPQGFRVRGDGELRNLRVSQPAGTPDWQASSGLAGMAPAPEGRYLSLVNGRADIVLAERAAPRPYLADANARLSRFERQGRGLRFGLNGYMPLEFALAGADRCRLRDGARELAPQRTENGLQYFRLEQHDAPLLELDCHD